MGRHAKEYSGERLTAKLPLQLTPSDRRKIDEAAAAEGVTPTDFARTLLLQAVGNYAIGGPARAAKRESFEKAIEGLNAAGKELNMLLEASNKVAELRGGMAIQGLSRKLIDRMQKVPAGIGKRRSNPQVKHLIRELAAIGNNVQQLRRFAEVMRAASVVNALGKVEMEMVRTLDRSVPA